MKIKIPAADFSSKEGKKLFTDIINSRSVCENRILKKTADIISNIRTSGDKALFEYTRKFDGYNLTSKNIRLSKEVIKKQADKCSPELAHTIKNAAKRIKAFHKNQKEKGFSIKTLEGRLSQLIRPVERTGVYVPGGHTVYPSSVLMNIIPAQIAGVKEIAVVTPSAEMISSSIAAALCYLGVFEVYRIGGAQSIAALAYGTESVPSVDKITGPGNAYVATAKKLVFGDVDIDSVAGPSEVAIIADSKADAGHVALDLLSQAEHGSGNETAVCFTESRAFAAKVKKRLLIEIEKSSVRETLEKLAPGAISIIITKSRNESIECVNIMAPEHLQIITSSCMSDLKKIRNSGAVFLGAYTPVATGDYYIGTNHVLPTGGTARFFSPLGVWDFTRRMSVAQLTKDGLEKCAPHVSRFARSEGFIHHAMSVEKRAGL